MLGRFKTRWETAENGTSAASIITHLLSNSNIRPRVVQNLGKSEFWEKKSLDNKSLIRRFGV